MTQSEVQGSRAASELRDNVVVVESAPVAPPPPSRASGEIDDLEPYNLPFTD